MMLYNITREISHISHSSVGDFLLITSSFFQWLSHAPKLID